eukprot:gene11344-18965_t
MPPSTPGDDNHESSSKEAETPTSTSEAQPIASTSKPETREPGPTKEESIKVDHVESEGSDVAPTRSILRGSSNNNASKRLQRPTTISWQDFQGQGLFIVHEYTPSESLDSFEFDTKSEGGCCTIS